MKELLHFTDVLIKINLHNYNRRRMWRLPLGQLLRLRRSLAQQCHYSILESAAACSKSSGRAESLLLRTATWGRLPLTPIRHARRIINESFVLIMFMTLLYLCSVLVAILLARCLWKRAHSGAITPLREKTSGVKVPCSTFIILSLYLRFFAASCLANIFSGDKWACEGAFKFVSRTSKKAFCTGRQKPRALISGLAPSSVAPATVSPLNGWRGGSFSTSVRTCARRFVSKSRILLWRIITNLPRLQLSA